MRIRNLASTIGIFVVPAVLIMVVVFDIPLILMLKRSFTDPAVGWSNYVELVTDSTYVRILVVTARVAALTTLFSALVGYPLAYCMTRLKGRTKTIALAAVVLPFWISILVRTYAWTVVLGRNGPLNDVLSSLGFPKTGILYTESGVLVGTVNVLLPFFVLPVYAAMLRVDESVLSAATVLGGSRRDVFWRVFVPITRPAAVSAGLLVFILSFGFYVTPAVLGGGRIQMLATLLDALVNRFVDWGLASAICASLLVLTLALYAASQRLVEESEPK